MLLIIGITAPIWLPCLVFLYIQIKNKPKKRSVGWDINKGSKQ